MYITLLFFQVQLERFRPCLVFFFFCHSISATHHSKILCLFGTITYFSSLNIFSHYLWDPYLSLETAFFFFSLVSKLTEPSEKKKKKNPEHEDQTNERRRNPEQTKPVKKKKIPQNSLNQWKKKGKKNWIVNPGEERKKKVKRWSKCVTKYCLWVPYVCLITILSLNYKLWKLKIAKICFQFP